MQYQLPPPMRGKWRAQRADRGAHAARGFVGGAAGFSAGYCGWRSEVSMPHAALWVVQRSGISKKLKPFCFNAARGFVGGAAGKRIASDTPNSEFQCRTRLCGWCSVVGYDHPSHVEIVSMPHAALWVVQLLQSKIRFARHDRFQCRTRLCGWCSDFLVSLYDADVLFQCRTRLCGWCSLKE